MEIFVNNKKGRVLGFFLKNPTRSIHLRELAREVRISFPWTRKIAYSLVKEQLLTKRKEGGLVIIKANTDNELFIAIKRSYNLYSLYKTALVSSLIEGYERPESIILFGSYGRGEDIETSDIDIAVITKKNKSIDFSTFEKALQRRVKVYELNRDAMHKEFWNTLANGIVLSGYLELK